MAKSSASQAIRMTGGKRLLKKRLGEVVTGKFGGLTPERIRIQDLTREVMQDYADNERASLGDVERRLRLHITPCLVIFGRVILGLQT